MNVNRGWLAGFEGGREDPRKFDQIVVVFFFCLFGGEQTYVFRVRGLRDSGDQGFR